MVENLDKRFPCGLDFHGNVNSVRKGLVEETGQKNTDDADKSENNDSVGFPFFHRLNASFERLILSPSRDYREEEFAEHVGYPDRLASNQAVLGEGSAGVSSVYIRFPAMFR